MDNTNETNVTEQPVNTMPADAKEEQAGESNEPQAITELKPIVLLMGELGNVAEKLVNKDFSSLFELTDEVIKLSAVDFKLAIAQLKDVDAVERAELKALLEEKFDLTNDGLEIIIEASLDCVEKGFSFVESLFTVAKHIKNYKKA